MKICYLADAGSIHTQRWIKYFADNGHEVHLISFRSLGDCNIKDVKLHLLKRLRPQIRFVSFPINLFFEVIQVRELIKKIKPDIVHVHYIARYGVLGLSGFHPLVATGWGSDILIAPKKSKIAKKIVKYTLKHADLFTSDSNYLRDVAIGYGAPSNNSYVINWGVDFKVFNPFSKPAKNELKANLNVCPIVISTRSFEYVYNIDIIIKAIPFVLKKVPNVKFILKNGYGTKGPELMNLTRKMGVADYTIIIDKMEDYDKMPYYLNMSDIYISVPSSDSTSVSLLEAMACGLPVIVSDLPANREWVKDGWNGYIVPTRDEKALADAIVNLLMDGEKRKIFGKRNYELVKEKADYEKNMKIMEELYESLLR